MRLIFQFAFYIAILVVGIFLGTENAALVDVSVFGRIIPQKPLWMLLLLAFAVGAFAALIFCAFEWIRLWRRIFSMNRKLKKAITQLEEVTGAQASELGVHTESTGEFGEPTLKAAAPEHHTS